MYCQLLLFTHSLVNTAFAKQNPRKNQRIGVLILLPYNFSRTLECHFLNASSILQVIRIIDQSTPQY